VDVSRDTPPSGCQEEIIVSYAVGSGVFGVYEHGSLTPDHAHSLGLSNFNSLEIAIVIGDDTDDTKSGNGQCDGGSEDQRMIHKEETDQTVEPRDPTGDSPVDVISQSIVHDIQRVEVAVFPCIEFEDIELLNEGRNDHRIGQSGFGF